MKRSGGGEAAKRNAAEHAAQAVEDGMTVGLGTGSTAAFAIRAIGRAVDAGLDVTGVATSLQSRALAREVGIPLASLPDVERIEIAIDGADQIADDGVALLKGGGAAHAREKVVDAAAEEFHVVVDDSKLAAALDRPVPVEVLPATREQVARAVEDAGGDPQLREATAKDGPVVTDNGNLVLDCAFDRIDDPAALAAELGAVPGVVEHGLFVDLAHVVHVGTGDGVDVRRPGPS